MGCQLFIRFSCQDGVVSLALFLCYDHNLPPPPPATTTSPWHTQNSKQMWCKNETCAYCWCVMNRQRRSVSAAFRSTAHGETTQLCTQSGRGGCPAVHHQRQTQHLRPGPGWFGRLQDRAQPIRHVWPGKHGGQLFRIYTELCFLAVLNTEVQCFAALVWL